MGGVELQKQLCEKPYEKKLVLLTKKVLGGQGCNGREGTMVHMLLQDRSLGPLRYNNGQWCIYCYNIEV